MNEMHPEVGRSGLLPSRGTSPVLEVVTLPLYPKVAAARVRRPTEILALDSRFRGNDGPTEGIMDKLLSSLDRLLAPNPL